MNVKELIDSYVTEVALRLPRKQRQDVAFELRALIEEGLADKAEAAGRPVDAAQAQELLQAFGHPREVAARYRPAVTVIDPADGRAFVRATLIGLPVIWILGLVARLEQPIGSPGELLGVLGQWWVGTVVGSLWWPGLLVVGYGLASWARRRWPEAPEWKPRSANRIEGGRTAKVLALLGILCGITALLDPRWVLDVFWGGHAAPAAYEAMTYTDAFRGRQGPVLLGLLLLNIPLFLAVIFRGRWTGTLRRLETALALLTSAAMVWTIADGPVFRSPHSDGLVKLILGLLVAMTLLDLGIKLLRIVRPAPNLTGTSLVH